MRVAGCRVRGAGCGMRGAECRVQGVDRARAATVETARQNTRQNTRPACTHKKKTAEAREADARHSRGTSLIRTRPPLPHSHPHPHFSETVQDDIQGTSGYSSLDDF